MLGLLGLQLFEPGLFLGLLDLVLSFQSFLLCLFCFFLSLINQFFGLGKIPGIDQFPGFFRFLNRLLGIGLGFLRHIHRVVRGGLAGGRLLLGRARP